MMDSILNQKKKACFLLLVAFVFISSAVISNAQAWIQKATSEPNKSNFYTIQKSFNDYWLGKQITKGCGWKPFKRWENFWSTRVDKDGNFPDAMKIYQDFNIWSEQNKSTPRISADFQWKILGPLDKPNATSGPTGMGRMNCIAFDPKNTNVLWAGAAYGGVWHSTDLGGTWETFPFTEFLSIGISDIVVGYPNAPSSGTFIYAATGDADGSLSGSRCYSIGIIKSTDGGKNWKATNFQKAIEKGVTINRILMHPTDANILYVAATYEAGDTTSTSGGLFKTIDGGDTWTRLSIFPFRDMEYKPNNPDIIYGSVAINIAGSDYIACMKYKVSTNELTRTPLMFPFPDVRRLAITVNKKYPENVYGILVASDDGLHSVVKTTDAGATWIYMAQRATHKDLLNAEFNVDKPTGNSQGWYDLGIACVPDNPDEVYIGGVNIVKLLNNGLQYSLRANWTTQFVNDGIQYVHADQHALEYSPSGVLYSCNDGGIAKSTDDGKTWVDLSKGLAITQFYHISSSRSYESMIIGGSQDNGTHILKEGIWTNIRGGDGMYSLIDPYDENLVYTSVYYGDFMKSRNGGGSLDPMIDTTVTHEKAAWVAPLVIDNTNPQILYAGYVNIWKGSNYGQQGQWIKISNFNDTIPINCIAIAPSDRNTVYLSKQNGLWYSKNINDNEKSVWTFITPAAPITDIVVDPLDATHYWTTFGSYMSNQKVIEWKGTSFVKYLNENLPNVPVNCMVYQNNSPEKKMYIGTDVGVFYRDKNMTKWEQFGTGLPNVVINDLDIQYSSGMLRAGTFGRGLWEVKISNCTIPAPVVITNTGKNTICPGDSLILISRDKYLSYKWSTGDTTNSIVVKKDGYYSLTVTDAKACQATSAPLAVTTGSVPEITINVEGNANPCDGDTLVLSVSPSSNFQTVVWSSGDTVKIISVTKSGKYSVMGITSGGCKSYSKEIEITLLPSPEKPAISRDNLTLTCTPADKYQWYFNNSKIISGGQKQSYIANKTGNYTVKVSNKDNCSNTSDLVYVDITSVNDDAGEYLINLHPNPTDSKLMFEAYFPQEGNISISISNLYGINLFSYDGIALQGQYKKEIDLHAISAGIYFVNIKINGNVFVKKLIKQ